MQQRTVLCLCVLLSIFLGSMTSRAETTVFGPHQVLVPKGRPVKQSHRFDAGVTSGSCRLEVVNGSADGANRVSNLSLVLNGTELVSSSSLNQGVAELKLPVILLKSNTLKLKVSGASGSFVTISILAQNQPEPPGDPPPVSVPTATLDAVPAVIAFGESTELVWQTTDADTVTLEPGFGVVAENGRVLVSPQTDQLYTLRAFSAEHEARADVLVGVIAQGVSATLAFEPDRIMAGETATMTWTTANAHTVSIVPAPGPVVPNGSIEITPTATTTYMLFAGNDTETLNIQATLTVDQPEPPPQVDDISFDAIDGQPAQGATVNRSALTLSGVVNVPLGAEAGVTVNGVLAQVDGQRFIANHVPLTEGWNALDVTARDNDGTVVAARLDVYAAPGTNSLRLRPGRVNGEAPLDVSFDLDVYPLEPLSGSQVQCTGPVGVPVVMMNLESWQATFPQPGLYDCSASATTVGGTHLSDRLGVRVWDRTEVDAQLQVKWSGMKSALGLGNITEAAGYFSSASRDVFVTQFEQLGTLLPEVVARMGQFRLVEIRENRAIYDLRTMQDGKEYSFQVDFIQDEDGIWRIWTF